MRIKKPKQSSTSRKEPRIRFLDGPMPSIYRNAGSQSPQTGLMGALQSVDTNSPEAKLNEQALSRFARNRTSISDNNGGMISRACNFSLCSKL